MPAFLANDILRLWRTFCVNYEARTERVPEEEKAKGKLKNYKLKHSRLLTCYSGILFLLTTHRIKGSVAPMDALEMISLTPTRRLEWLLKQAALSTAHPVIASLLGHYEHFLETTNVAEKELVHRFMDKDASRQYMNSATEFGDLVFQVLTQIGDGKPFHRHLVV